MKQEGSLGSSTTSTMLATTISWSKAILAVGLLLLALTSLSEGGCSRFGHSCFGAHGKRAGGGLGNIERPDMPSDPLAPVLLPTGIELNSGRFPDYDAGRRRMSPYVRDWILGMRRDGTSEEGQSNGGEQRRK